MMDTIRAFFPKLAFFSIFKKREKRRLPTFAPGSQHSEKTRKISEKFEKFKKIMENLENSGNISKLSFNLLIL